MKIEKEHKQSTLMNWAKKDLVERILCLEHNNNVLHDTIDTQASNYIKMTSWVPVSERLPEDGVKVLVTAKDMDMETAYYDYEGWHLAFNGRIYARDPLAWMPLPEAYKPGALKGAGAEAGQYADAGTLRPAT